MAGFAFKRAVKKDELLRLALMGPPGAGKTYSALRIATALGGPTAFIDSERGSARKYADRFEFDHLDLPRHSPADYVEAIRAAEKEGYKVVIVDSLSHAWAGKGGALEMVDEKAAASKSRNSFEAWRHVTPEHNKLVDALVSCKAHLIATLRTKVEYVVERDERTGKSTPRKVGMAPIQRDGLEFEFDVVGEFEDAVMRVTKTRCPDLEKVYREPGEAFVDTLRPWLGSSNEERVAKLRGEIEALLPRVHDRAAAEKALNEWAGENTARLMQLLEKVRAKIGLAEAQEPAAPAEGGQ